MKNKNMLKIVYILFFICYCLVALVYFFRYDISYHSVKASPETVTQRDLTYQEHKALKEATHIRKKISAVMLIFSTIVATLSLLVWYYKPFDSIGFVKIVFFASIALVFFLFIVSGVKFIPTPPIR